MTRVNVTLSNRSGGGKACEDYADPQPSRKRLGRRNRNFRGSPGRENGAIVTFGNLDDPGIVAAFFVVILAKAAAEPAGLYADRRVHGRIISGVAIEYVDCDAVFLYSYWRIREGGFD